MAASSRVEAEATRPTVVRPALVSLTMSAAWMPCARSSLTDANDSTKCASSSSSPSSAMTMSTSLAWGGASRGGSSVVFWATVDMV